MKPEMTQHEDEAALRGHGPRAACDHNPDSIYLIAGNSKTVEWCRRCGAIHLDGEWWNPGLLTDLEWGDRPLPEDASIESAFPTRNGRHDTYGEAMRLVGARHSKGRLVALVHWLLCLRDDAARDRDTMCETLTIAQQRGTDLVEENRLLKARLARYGG